MRFEIYQDKASERWRWRLRGAHGQAIAVSATEDGWETKHEARTAAVRVRQDAQSAEVAIV